MLVRRNTFLYPAGEERGSLFTSQTAIVLLGIFVALAIILSLMGRDGWCSCGFGLWTSDAWSNNTSQNLGDPYSFSHVLHGLLFYGVLTLVARQLPLRHRLLLAVLLEVAWEILENTPFVINKYRAGTASLEYYGDSVLNSVGDVLSTIFGFWVAARVPWRWSVGFFVVLELLMLFTIRDNLTLNVLMLVHPIDFIKEWQIEGPLSSR
jgi:hypothetical protein